MSLLKIKQISGSISQQGSLFMISSGSVSASVNTNPNDLFLIKSGSSTFLNISSSSNFTIFSNLFVIRNFTTNDKILEVSGSIVKFPTHSIEPSSTTEAGSIWFTSSSFYVGLE